MIREEGKTRDQKKGDDLAIAIAAFTHRFCAAYMTLWASVHSPQVVSA